MAGNRALLEVSATSTTLGSYNDGIIAFARGNPGYGVTAVGGTGPSGFGVSADGGAGFGSKGGSAELWPGWRFEFRNGRGDRRGLW